MYVSCLTSPGTLKNTCECKPFIGDATLWNAVKDGDMFSLVEWASHKTRDVIQRKVLTTQVGVLSTPHCQNSSPISPIKILQIVRFFCVRVEVYWYIPWNRDRKGHRIYKSNLTQNNESQGTPFSPLVASAIRYNHLPVVEWLLQKCPQCLDGRMLVSRGV
jgi:hypothetical protein